MVGEFPFECLEGPNLLFTVPLQFVDLYFLLPSKVTRIIGGISPLLGLTRTRTLFERLISNGRVSYEPHNLCDQRALFFRAWELQSIPAWDSLKFGDMGHRRKQHKCTTWVILVMWRPYCHFYDLYFGPGYKDCQLLSLVGIWTSSHLKEGYSSLFCHEYWCLARMRYATI